MAGAFKRVDLRSPLETRDMTADLGLICECDGSAEVSQGKTRVVVSVAGPALAKFSRLEKHDKGTIDVEVKFSAPEKENIAVSLFERSCEKFLVASLGNCLPLEDFPRMVITVKVIVIEDAGGAMAVALNACSFALLDAALPMKYVPNAVSIALWRDYESHSTTSGSSYSNSTSGSGAAGDISDAKCTNILYLDPTLEEERRAASMFVFAMNPTQPASVKILASDCTCLNGCSFTVDELTNAIACASKAAPVLLGAMRKILDNKLLPSHHS